MFDYLSGWPLAKAIPDKEASAVVATICEKFTLEHASPEILLSDNGKQFTNDLLAYICDHHNIEQQFSYMPQLNGKIENFSRLLGLKKKIMSR